MPLKSWIKFCWSISLILSIAIGVSLFPLFFTDSFRSGELKIDFDDTPPSNSEEKPQKHGDFVSIWKANINVDRQMVTTSVPLSVPIKKPSIQQIVESNIAIKNIFNEQRALIIIKGEDVPITVVPLNPKTVPGINNAWKWDLDLGTQRVLVTKLIPQQGIEFSSLDRKEKAWLRFSGIIPKDIKSHNTDKDSESQNNPASNKTDKDAPNYVISSEEAEQLANSYNEIVTELSPEPSTDPPGLEIRRVIANSKAYNYGLRTNDIISTVNGKSIRTTSQIEEMLHQNQKQNRVVVVILRKMQNSNTWKPVKLTFETR